MRIAGTFALCCALAGCATDDESVTSVEQGLSWRTVWSRATTNAPPLDLGPADNQTCFLSGVAGNLNSGYEWYDGELSRVRVYTDNGHYWLEVDSGKWDQGSDVGRKLAGHATCVNIRTNVTGGYWEAGDYPVTIEPTAPNRHCFLSAVWGAGGTWLSSGDNVRVKKDNGNWVLDGTVGWDPYSHSSPKAEAVCIDFPSDTWSGSGWIEAADPGTYTVNHYAYDSEQMACGITGIQGHFDKNDWDDGAMLDWPASFPGWWSETVTNGKKIWSTCVQ